MDMQLIEIPHDRNMCCPFCGEKPDYVWSSKLVEDFYKGEILHQCDGLGYIRLRVKAYGRSRIEATNNCINNWCSRESI